MKGLCWEPNSLHVVHNSTVEGSNNQQKVGIPQLGEQSVKAFPAINIQDGQPELSPGRDGHCTTCEKNKLTSVASTYKDWPQKSSEPLLV
jgi:hypothetical protein